MPKFTKQLGKALMANIVYPGAGQLFLKKWIRAGLFTLMTVSTFIWLLWAFVDSIINNYYRLAEGGEIKFNLLNMVFPFFVIFILWVYTYIDLFLFCNVPEENGASANNNSEK